MKLGLKIRDFLLELLALISGLGEFKRLAVLERAYLLSKPFYLLLCRLFIGFVDVLLINPLRILFAALGILISFKQGDLLIQYLFLFASLN